MTERDENFEYIVQPTEAAIVIKPDGQVEVLMPESDEDEHGMLSSDSPSFKAMVIIAFINNKELREQVTTELIQEHFTQPE